jgi:Zn-dependent protease with chaperone function
MSKLIFASSVTLGLLFIFATGGAMAVLVFVGTVNLVFAISFTLVIGVLSWLVGPFFTDYISKWFYKLEFHTEEEIKSMHPEVWELIHAIVTENNFKFPKVGIIPDENPTAYTYGSGRWNSRLVMTKGISINRRSQSSSGTRDGPHR